MLLRSCCGYFYLWFLTFHILGTQIGDCERNVTGDIAEIGLGCSESNATEDATEVNFCPDVNMTAITFYTKSDCREHLSNSTSSKDDCEEVQRFPNSSIILVPVTFKEITFSCDSHFPTSWKFHKPPFQDISIQSITITKHRHVKIFNGSEDDSRGSYLYHSTLTITFKHFLERKLWPISCRGSKMNGFGNWSTVIQGESDCTNPLKLKITISKLNDSELHDEKREPRVGANKFCNVTLAVDTKRKTFACGSTATNGWSRPGIISCKTKDECVSIYSMDSKTCNDTFHKGCTAKKTCQHFLQSQLPGVIRCSDDFGNSIARSFLFPHDGKLVYEFWDDPNPQLDLQSLSTHPMENRAKLQFYYGQNVTFKCSASGSLFSFGFQWVLTTHAADSSNSSEKIYLGNGEEDLISEDNMYNITKAIHFKKEYGSSVTLTCFAPVWNRKTWIQKSITFNLSHPLSPKLIQSANGCQQNDQTNQPTFLCQASGKPAPDFYWIVREKGSKGKRVRELCKRGENDVTCASHPFINDTDDVVVTSKLHFQFQANIEYTIICNATNFHGNATKEFECDRTEKPTVYQALIVGLTLALFIATCGGALGVVRMRRRAQHAYLRMTEAEIKLFEAGDPDADGAFALPYNQKKFEIELEELEINFNEVLGQGEFGSVACGWYRGVKVAVKMLKPTAELIHFKTLMSEIKLMCFMDKHPHLVNFVGAYTKDKQHGHAYLLTEYCAGGNLLRHLQMANNSSSLTSGQMTTWAYECACAMEYLSLKNFIHKDIAARNILLTEKLRAKVGDFGISKHLEDFSQKVYYQKTKVPLPLKWMAIESLRNLEFSTKTDVWSFGVLLWEIFSLGESPYPGLPLYDRDCYHLLLEGLRMNKPKGCSDEMYALMRVCWETDPKKRPTFSEIRECLLTRILEAKVNMENEPELNYANLL